MSIRGSFTASGGSGNDIRVLIMDSTAFTNWQNGHQVNIYYDSGQQTTGSISTSLPNGPGTYYLVYNCVLDVDSELGRKETSECGCESVDCFITGLLCDVIQDFTGYLLLRFVRQCEVWPYDILGQWLPIARKTSTIETRSLRRRGAGATAAHSLTRRMSPSAEARRTLCMAKDPRDSNAFSTTST